MSSLLSPCNLNEVNKVTDPVERAQVMILQLAEMIVDSRKGLTENIWERIRILVSRPVENQFQPIRCN